MLKLRPNIHSLLRPVTCNLGQSLCASNSSIWASDKKKQTNYLLWARNFHSSPSVSSIVKSRFESVPLSQKDVFSFVWENVSKYGHRTAMVSQM